jgi:hypothetical protein
MPLYRPSILGAVAAAIFFVLAVIAFSDKEWVDVLMWALLGIAFAISVTPRRTFGSHTSIVAGGMLAIGTILFLLDAAEKLTS